MSPTFSLLLQQVAIAAMMQSAAEKLGYKSTKDCLLGEYDYKHYCTPKWPYGKGVKASLPPFFGLKEKMPILLGMLMVHPDPSDLGAGAPDAVLVYVYCTKPCWWSANCMQCIAIHAAQPLCWSKGGDANPLTCTDSRCFLVCRVCRTYWPMRPAMRRRPSLSACMPAMHTRPATSLPLPSSSAASPPSSPSSASASQVRNCLQS